MDREQPASQHRVELDDHVRTDGAAEHQQKSQRTGKSAHHREAKTQIKQQEQQNQTPGKERQGFVQAGDRGTTGGGMPDSEAGGVQDNPGKQHPTPGSGGLRSFSEHRQQVADTGQQINKSCQVKQQIHGPHGIPSGSSTCNCARENASPKVSCNNWSISLTFP